MGRLLRYLLLLVALAAAGGAIYALVAELPAPTRAVEIDLGPAGLD